MEKIEQLIQKRNSDLIDRQRRSFGELNADLLVKGKVAEEGEIREWSGQKFKKQGKEWVPVSGNRKQAPKKVESKSGKKEEDTSSKQKQDKPTQDAKEPVKVSSVEKAQFSRIQEAMSSGNLDQAAKIADSLSDEAKSSIPPKVWKQLLDHKEKPQQEVSKTDQVEQEISEDNKSKLKSFIAKNREMFDTGEHANEERSKLAKFVRGKAKGLVKGLKHEIHHIKEGGSAIKKLVTGKSPNDHEKKALKKIGISLGLTLGSMVATGGLSVFAHGAGSFLSHLGIHFVEHMFLETAGLAALFAKAIEDGDLDIENSLTEQDLEKLLMLFAEYIETGDWSSMLQETQDQDE